MESRQLFPLLLLLLLLSVADTLQNPDTKWLSPISSQKVSRFDLVKVDLSHNIDLNNLTDFRITGCLGVDYSNGINQEFLKDIPYSKSNNL